MILEIFVILVLLLKLQLKFIFDENLFLIKKTFFSMPKHANMNFI